VGGAAIGVLVGAIGGLVYLLAGGGTVGPPVGTAFQVLGVVAFLGLVVVLVRSRPGGGGDRPPPFGRTYRLVVLGEVVAIVAGIAVLNPLGLNLAVLPWVTLVVGVHFVVLGRVWRAPSLAVVGAAVAVVGAVGFVVALTGASAAVIAAVTALPAGVLLLGGSWFGALRPV
jgi:hypothetical protein